MIALVAFITMFSTTLACMDGYSRTLATGVTLFRNSSQKIRSRLTLLLMPVLGILSFLIIAFLISSMKALVDLATVLAFLTAPLVAILNFKVIHSDDVPDNQRPGRFLVALSWAGITFLSGFSLFWIWLRWIK